MFPKNLLRIYTDTKLHAMKLAFLNYETSVVHIIMMSEVLDMGIEIETSCRIAPMCNQETYIQHYV